MTRLLPYYLLSVNLLTFIAYGLDKWKAVHNGNKNKNLSRRIPEASLLLLAILGGSPAALLAMRFSTTRPTTRSSATASLLFSSCNWPWRCY